MNMADEETAPAKSRTLKDIFIGDYDYKKLCMPRLNPWRPTEESKLPFYGPDESIPFLLAMFLGFQHSLAVVGGTALPGIILGNLDPEGKAAPYLVSYALLTSGICSWIQILHMPVPKTKYYLGSGLMCLIATSFAFLPTAEQVIKKGLKEGKSFDEAYGSLLGVFLLGSVFQAGIAFIPPKILRRVFPSWLAGMGVFLIGVNLVGVGVSQWGTKVTTLPEGSSEYIGLGFFAMCTMIVMELFGSHFVRSCSIAIAILIGYALSAITTDRNGDAFVDTTPVDEAPVILFLWTKTFPIGFHAPAFLPTLIAYIVSTIETYGDTTATLEASGYTPEDKEWDESIQGGLLGDSVNSFISAISLVLPSTTLSQNIGIISLTNVAAKSAGYACGFWMILYGIFGKMGAFFTIVPLPVFGGISTFLFANIAVSGIRVMTSEGVGRRARFILAISLSFGLGTTLKSNWISYELWDCTAIENEALNGLCEGVILTMDTGYAIGCIVALILNLVLPMGDSIAEGIPSKAIAEEVEMKELIIDEKEGPVEA